MKRDIEKKLVQWKDDPGKKPLLIRGARQTGKTWSVEHFGKEHFPDCITINFEQQPEYKKCFETLYPNEIIQKISILSEKHIRPGHVLLFFDEIQECPEAIIALRYFYEQMPELHVIGAGSLLEFTIRRKEFRMPVGRVRYMFMKPMSFGEFLTACGHENIRQAICSLYKKPEDIMHDHFLSIMKKYMFLGGMPAVVAEFVKSGNMRNCLDLQADIINTYKDDFPKYASESEQDFLSRVFTAIPMLVGKKFIYSKVDRTARTEYLKKAVELLEAAGVITKVRMSSGAGVPLEAGAKEKHFKALFLDVGLMQSICGLNAQLVLEDDLLKINNGSLAEQLVGQELLAYGETGVRGGLHYWERESPSSSAEVDYLIARGAVVLPVEVKAGKGGRLKSLHMFMENYGLKTGIQVSQAVLKTGGPVQSIPLYAVESLFS